MITITRRQADGLRAVFRRAALGVTHRGALRPLVFDARRAELCLKHRYDALGVVCALTGHAGAHETLLLSLDALGDFAGRFDTPVVLEAAGPGRTLARWEERRVPQAHEYAVPAPDAVQPFPEAPTEWSDTPAELLGALADASQTCAESDTRYSLSSVQLRGEAGEVVATDGHQLLVHRGFAFPWREDLLVKRSPVFGSPALPRDRPLRLGRTETHVVLRADAWTLFLEARRGARFPDVARVIPAAGAAATRLCLDEGDAAFLAETLDALPGGDRIHGPLTLDLNGRVTLRARGGDPDRVTELVLSRSRYAGSPVRLCGDRELLGRALRLGFCELELDGAKAPVVARDARRLYVWQTLDPESAVGPSRDVTRIESCADTTVAADPARPAKERNAMRERNDSVTNGAAPRTAPNGPAAPAAPDTGATGPAALVREAEALHGALADAKARAARLVAALRRWKKRDRLVAGALTALKGLELPEAGE